MLIFHLSGSCKVLDDRELYDIWCGYQINMYKCIFSMYKSPNKHLTLFLEIPCIGISKTIGLEKMSVLSRLISVQP